MADPEEQRQLIFRSLSHDHDAIAPARSGKAHRLPCVIAATVSCVVMAAVVVLFASTPEEPWALGLGEWLTGMLEYGTNHWQSVGLASTNSSVCVLHVSFGTLYQRISESSGPTKRQYADRHGYRLVAMQEETFEELVDGHFAKCVERFKTVYDCDKQSVLKFCGVWEAFEDGCETVLWTDSDGVIFSESVGIHHWFDEEPKADVIWAMTDDFDGWCSRPKPCTGVSRWATCLNSGVFVIQRTSWSQAYIARLLDQSCHSLASNCSTSSLNPFRFDQCNFGGTPWQLEQSHVGDQCVITCDAMHDDSAMSHFGCSGYKDAISMQFMLDANLFTNYPRELYWIEYAINQLRGIPTHLPTSLPSVPKNAFAVNCMRGGTISRVNCVRYAAYQSDGNH